MSSDIIANRLSEALANVALLDPIHGKQKQLSRPIDIPSATEQWILSGAERHHAEPPATLRSLWSDNPPNPWSGREYARRPAGVGAGSAVSLKQGAGVGAGHMEPRDGSGQSARTAFARHSSWSDPLHAERVASEEHAEVFDAVHTTSTRMTDFILDDPLAHNRGMWARPVQSARTAPSRHDEGPLTAPQYSTLSQAQQRPLQAPAQYGPAHAHQQHSGSQHLSQRVHREALSAHAAMSASAAGHGHSHSHGHSHGHGHHEPRVRHFSLSSYESMDSFFDAPEPKSPMQAPVRLQRLNTYSGHTSHSDRHGYSGSYAGSSQHYRSNSNSSGTYDFHPGSLPSSASAGPRVPSFSSAQSSATGGPPRLLRQSSNMTAPPGTIYVNTVKKRQSSQAANAESYDIEQGLSLQRVAQIPFVGGRKVVAYHSKRTNRRTVVSVIDPKYLLGPGHQEHCDGESGFLTFHDCVELRTLKTGETLTRNQRNNLRKRLATTARTIVQVDVPRLLQDFSDPDCCPRTTYHHSKLNAYLVTTAVGQVLLCTRDNDSGAEPYKGQSLQSQTLFDLCKSENAAAALAEFIKANQNLDLNTRDFKGMCPIHYSAKAGLKDTIDVLIKFGADVNVTDKSDQSPLHYAIYNGHKPVQFQLLQAGARVDTRNVSGNTLLHVAAYHDQREVAAAILAQSPELVHVRNHKFDSTPLECAMHKGLTEMVKLLSMQAPPLSSSAQTAHHPSDHVRPLSAMLPSDMLDGDDLF